MKAILPRQELLEALQACSTLTSGRTTKPVLSHVKLDVRKDALELSATDGEAALRMGVTVLKVEKPGVAVVPADRLLGIVREMSDVEIAIEAGERDFVISEQSSKFRIYSMSAADFAPVPDFDDEADLVLNGAELRRMISLTLFAAARETSRYAINGVLWEKNGKRLYQVATDGRRLARTGGSIAEANSGDFEAIVPAKALSVFEKVFGGHRGEDWSVEIRVLPNQILMRSGDRVLSTVLVEGHFPKYDDVIPKNNELLVRVGREELLGAVRRAALLTTEESRAVKFALGDDGLVITAQSAEQGDARVQIPVAYDGPEFQIGFNPTFLVDALRAISMEEVYIELQEPTRPGVLRGEDREAFLYVVMPVALAG